MHSWHVYIDDQLVASEVISFFFKVDPFPGDHQYRLHVKLIEPLSRYSAMGRLADGVYRNIDEHVQHYILDDLDYLLSRHDKPHVQSPHYLINNISCLAIEHMQIEVWGICSTVLKRSAVPLEGTPKAGF